MVNGHLVAGLRGRVKFQSRDNDQLLQDVCTEIWRQKPHGTGDALTAVTGGILPTDARLLCWGQKTGIWILIAPYTVDSEELKAR